MVGRYNTDCNSIQGSASIIHVPTGLFLTGQAGQIEDKNSMAAYVAASGLPLGSSRAGDDPKHSVWSVQAGWKAKLNSLGNTIFWGQVVQYDTGLGVRNTAVQTVAAGDVINSLGATALIAGSQTRYWGGGISQEINAASMVLYAGYHVGSTDLTLQAQSPTATVQRRASHAIDDFQMFYTGATLRF